MNIAVIWCVVTLVILCFIGAVGSGLWIESFEGVLVPFIYFGGTYPCCESGVYSSYQGFLTFWTFVIILQVLLSYKYALESARKYSFSGTYRSISGIFLGYYTIISVCNHRMYKTLASLFDA